MHYACTCYAALGENNKIFGRNFDFYNHPALILFTDPPDGYSSVSMLDLYYLGYTFELTPLDDQKALINSPYIPIDGMNENGLAAGMMAVHNAEGNSDPTKVTLAELEIIRLVLDYARDVPEALDLIQQYNVIFEEVPIHYMFADALGNSVVVEYLNGNIITIENDQPWQVSTNFIISEEMPVGSNSSCWRFNSVYDALQSTEGRITPFEGMNLLEEVSQPGEFATRWSVVYDLMEKSILLAVGRNYEEIFSFSLTNQE